MKILVFGAGALGSLFGGILSQKAEVTLVGREEHMRAIRDEGLNITGKTEMVVHPMAVTDLKGVEPPDLILVTTKSYDTDAAMKELTPFHNSSIFLSLQNGIGNEEVMNRYAQKVVGGVTSHGVTFLGPGRIRHAGKGHTTIGNFSGVSEQEIEDIKKLFVEAGIETTTSVDIRKEVWMKAIVNAVINPLTAITRLPNRCVLEIPDLEGLLHSICEEAVRVATAKGIQLELDEVVHRTREIARLTAENMSSMLQDVMRRKRTEIESINGAIVRYGEEEGVATPVNATIATLIRAIERGYDIPLPRTEVT